MGQDKIKQPNSYACLYAHSTGHPLSRPWKLLKLKRVFQLLARSTASAPMIRTPSYGNNNASAPAIR